MSEPTWAAMAITVALLLITAGSGMATLRFFGGSPPEQRVYDALGALALGAIVAAPGVLALLARHDRPSLLLPAMMLFADYARRSRAHPISPPSAFGSTTVPELRPAMRQASGNQGPTAVAPNLNRPSERISPGRGTSR